MFVLIQIPCRDEAAILPVTLAALPSRLPHVDRIERLIIDDGSVDGTVDAARAAGVEHIVSLGARRGLARAYMAGLRRGLALGADIIVNTDADNQYCADDIGALVAPILAGHADLVIGARPIAEIASFSPTKKALQRLGSWTVRQLSGAQVADAPSGFRAVSREAAASLFVHDGYSYTLETLIQAGRGGFRIVSAPIRVNPPTRPSRLVKSTAGYVARSVIAMGRAFLTYRPFLVFAALALGAAVCAAVMLLAGAVAFGAALFALSGASVLAGVLANQIAANRRLIEDMRAASFDAADAARARGRAEAAAPANGAVAVARAGRA